MSEDSSAAPDAEAALQSRLAAMLAPRADIATLTRHLQELQRQLAALDGFLLAAARGNSLDARLHHGASAIMAAEAVGAAAVAIVQSLAMTSAGAASIERGLRRAIGAAMLQEGVASFPLDHHTLDASAGTSAVEIVAPGELPSKFWRHAEPTPDKRAIGAALKKGPVPGARMAQPVPGVRITARSNRP